MDDKTQKHLGFWRPTSLGIAFARGQCSIPWKVCLWDATKIGESEETITIGDALDSGGFDYKEVLENPDTEVPALLDGKKKTVKKSTTLKFGV